MDVGGPHLADDTIIASIQHIQGKYPCEVPSDVVHFVVDQSKVAGNKAFRDRDFRGKDACHCDLHCWPGRVQCKLRCPIE
jgi:hypothetical protein